MKDKYIAYKLYKQDKFIYTNNRINLPLSVKVTDKFLFK